MKHLLFVCRYIEPFRSYALPIDGERRNFWVFPANFSKGGEKIFRTYGVLRLDPTPNLCGNFAAIR